jgi:hypothetical protein
MALRTSPIPRKIDTAQVLKDCEKRWRRWAPPQVQRQISRCHRALADHAAGHDLPAHGRRGRRSHHLSARVHWRRAQLGLPLLLAARHHLHLLALANGGYFNEAAAWQDWLLRALAGSPEQVQIMYGLKGERQLLEWEVGWLPGYENSKPVRIGNAAAGRCSSTFTAKCWTASSTRSTAWAGTPRMISRARFAAGASGKNLAAAG